MGGSVLGLVSSLGVSVMEGSCLMSDLISECLPQAQEISGILRPTILKSVSVRRFSLPVPPELADVEPSLGFEAGSCLADRLECWLRLRKLFW